jgi:hypothetical protein
VTKRFDRLAVLADNDDLLRKSKSRIGLKFKPTTGLERWRWAARAAVLVDNAPGEHAALYGAGAHILVAEQQFKVRDTSVGALDALEEGQELAII